MDDQATTKTLLLAEEQDHGQPEAEYEQTPSQRSASGPSRVFWMVAPLVVLAFIESFSFGILSPMLSIVQTEYFARQINEGAPIDCAQLAHTEACTIGSQQADWWSSIFSSAGSICFFFLSPIIGQASDAYGRKPFLVATQIFRLGYPLTILLFSQLNSSIMPFYWLRFIFSAFSTMAVLSASIADVVSAENRASAFGLLGAAFSVGFCCSSGIAPLMSRIHLLQFAQFLMILRVFWVIVVLPETLPASKRTHKRHRRLENPMRGFSILFRSQLFIRLTSLIVLSAFVQFGLMQIQMFYLNTFVGFNEKDMAHLMLVGGLTAIFAQSLVLKPLMDCIHEKGVIIVALIGSILATADYIVTAFYPLKWVVYVGTLPNCISELSFAAISSLKSINCSEKEQGRLQGAIYGARAVFEATGPIVFAAMYGRIKQDDVWSRAMPFFVAGAIYLVGMGIAISIPTRNPDPVEVLSPTASSVRSVASSKCITDTDEEDEDEGNGDEDVLFYGRDDASQLLAEPLLGSYAGVDYSVVDM